MQHGIRGDGIHRAVGPAVGVHRAREVGLLVEDVVPLQHHREFLAFHETVRELRVPYQLVGIERGVAVAPLAEHMEIGGEIGAPRERDARVASIREVPGGEVVGGLEPVFRTGISDI